MASRVPDQRQIVHDQLRFNTDARERSIEVSAVDYAKELEDLN